MFRLLIKALYFIPVPYIYGSKVKWIQPVIYGKVRAKRKKQYPLKQKPT
ncbi:hypothetical protein M124_1152 [Bacteroides fragilis str. 3988T(B)14]|uniref:Uncharacterized protein n=1 Tax=Bacteroides fragilis str. 3988T(B)14 TaxID=1339315 RepID=A0A015SXP5_BACFG|nr:hypothetical protein M124_1152 [Bacteroides fragilis str. 3988T(B)14]EXY81032.1 hypothetical protein M084_1188 [Bacteroides fragilis str. 3988 T1]